MSSFKAETTWTDKFGEHFEVRAMAHGKMFSRHIIRDPNCAWAMTWDEARAAVDEEIQAEEQRQRRAKT